MTTPREPSRSLLFNLGAFFGGVMKGIKADPVRGTLHGRRETEAERTLANDQAKVTLRRRVIDEVYIKPVEERKLP